MGLYGPHREVGRRRGGQALVGRHQGLRRRRRWVLVGGCRVLVGVHQALAVRH